MKNRTRLIISLTFFACLVSCSETKIIVDCTDSDGSIDKDFCQMFNEAILSLQSDDTIATYSRVHSMIILEAVTGIRSQAHDLHHPYYSSSGQLKSDMKKWRKWFEKNKQYWTKERADSIVLIFSSTH